MSDGVSTLGGAGEAQRAIEDVLDAAFEGAVDGDAVALFGVASAVFADHCWVCDLPQICVGAQPKRKRSGKACRCRQRHVPAKRYHRNLLYGQSHQTVDTRPASRASGR
jgi:hypothetical protein